MRQPFVSTAPHPRACRPGYSHSTKSACVHSLLPSTLSPVLVLVFRRFFGHLLSALFGSGYRPCLVREVGLYGLTFRVEGLGEGVISGGADRAHRLGDLQSIAELRVGSRGVNRPVIAVEDRPDQGTPFPCGGVEGVFDQLGCACDRRAATGQVSGNTGRSTSPGTGCCHPRSGGR